MEGSYVCDRRYVNSLHTPVFLFPEPPNWTMLSLSFGGICFLFLDLHFRAAVMSSTLKPLLNFLSLALRAVFMIKRGSYSFDSLSLRCRWWGWTRFHYELQSEAFKDCSLLCKKLSCQQVHCQEELNLDAYAHQWDKMIKTCPI